MDQFVGAPAKGDLAGTYPAPRVAALTTTDGPTKLTIGDIAHGEFLIRDGTTVVGSAGGGGGLPSGAVPGGDLSGTYPSPGVATSGGNAIVTAVTAGAGDLGGTYPAPTVLKLTESAGPTSLTLGAVPATGWLHRDGAANVVGSVQLFTPLVTIAVAGSNFNTDCALGNVFKLTLVAPTEILTAPTNGVEGATYLWHIDQNLGGTGILTYHADFAFPGGTAPVMTTAGGSNLVLSAVYSGGVFWTTFSQDFA